HGLLDAPGDEFFFHFTIPDGDLPGCGKNHARTPPALSGLIVRKRRKSFCGGFLPVHSPVWISRTSALSGPSRITVNRASTAARGPTSTASTLPSGILRTKPFTPWA